MSIDEYEIMRQADVLSFEKSSHINKLSQILSTIVDSVIPTAEAEDGDEGEQSSEDENIDTKDLKNVSAMASGISFGLTGATLAIIFASVPKIKASLMCAYATLSSEVPCLLPSQGLQAEQQLL